MPKDDWEKAARKDIGKAEISRHIANKAQLPDRDRVGEKKWIINELVRRYKARLDTEGESPIIRIDTTAIEEEDVIGLQITIKDLGYNFKRTKANPLQQGQGFISINAAHFAKKCHDKGWDCSSLIDQNTMQQLLEKNSSRPEDRRLGPGGSEASTRDRE